MIDRNYKEWLTTIKEYETDCIQELQEKYLNKLKLSVEVNEKPNFDVNKEKWFASYEHSENKIENGIVLIAFNHAYLYTEMKKRKIDKDEFNIEAQGRITTGHEIAHGIIDYLVNWFDADVNNIALDEFIRDIQDGELEEEELCEEFGESCFPEATGVWESRLGGIIDKIV